MQNRLNWASSVGPCACRWMKCWCSILFELSLSGNLPGLHHSGAWQLPAAAQLVFMCDVLGRETLQNQGGHVPSLHGVKVASRESDGHQSTCKHPAPVSCPRHSEALAISVSGQPGCLQTFCFPRWRSLHVTAITYIIFFKGKSSIFGFHVNF